MNLAPGPSSGALARGFAAALVATLLAACSSESPSTSDSGGPDGSHGPVPTASIEVPPSFGPPASVAPTEDAAPITIDPTLLELFPESIGDIPVIEDPNEAALALSDPALPRIATAVDAAAAVDAKTGNLVFAWIVRLRPGVFNDTDFRQWRDAYDDGACNAAGGVVGRASALIGDREAFVTSCQAGLHTYHVWVKEADILVSASSIGAARFGEQLLAGLRIPE